MNSYNVIFFNLTCIILIKYKQLLDKTRISHELLYVHNDINATSAAHITTGTSKMNVSHNFY